MHYIYNTIATAHKNFPHGSLSITDLKSTHKRCSDEMQVQQKKIHGVDKEIKSFLQSSRSLILKLVIDL